MCQELLQLKASDPDLLDYGKLMYAITAGNQGDMFVVDPRTGILHLNCDPGTQLDRETTDSYMLQVTARDTADHLVSSDSVKLRSCVI